MKDGRREGGKEGTEASGNAGTPEHSLLPSFHPTTLVIQTAFLGDVVLTTPLLSVLADRHGPVDVLTTPAAGSLLETHPAVGSVIRYDKRAADRGWRGFKAMAAELRSRRYATIYLPHRSLRSATLALLSGAPERVGFGDSAAAVMYTRRVPRIRSGHEVERLLALAGPDIESPPVALGLTTRDHAEAEAWLAAHGVSPKFVALAPGSIWGTKRWPYFTELAGMLDRHCVIVGSAEDGALADAIVAAAPGRAVSAAGALGLRASAALIQRARRGRGASAEHRPARPGCRRRRSHLLSGARGRTGSFRRRTTARFGSRTSCGAGGDRR